MRKLRFLILILILALITGIYAFSNTSGLLQGQLSPTPLASQTQNSAGNLSFQADALSLKSSNIYLLELDSGNILYEKNSQKRIYPASITKIMTAILAIELLPDLNDRYTIPYDIFSDLYEADASLAGFEGGESVSVKDLIYGAMLPSGADATATLAIAACGSEAAFIARMNEKAAKLGMHNTHFTNTSGLHNSKHYSTVEDLAILLQYALGNSFFHEVFSTSTYTTDGTSQHPDGLKFRSTMSFWMNEYDLSCPALIGGKTGYTKSAGLCLASAAEIGGKRYLLVTAGANGNNQTEPFHVMDAVQVYNAISAN